MVGNKLHQLIQELNLSQRKSLLYQCTISSDKRLDILKTLILSGCESPKNLHEKLEEQVNIYWAQSNDDEKALKIRRLSSFFVKQIEEVLLSTHLQNNSCIKHLLLAQQISKNGNLSLLNHYFDKAYTLAVQEEDLYYQLIGLKGKIRMKYASQNEKDLSKALELNEELIRILRHANNDKITEYYSNISNIYLEKNSLIEASKEELEKEIFAYIHQFDYPLNKASLYLSLAKLNYDNSKLTKYLSQAKKIMEETSIQNLDYQDLDRKIRFMELRLNFFAGTEIKKMLRLSENTIEHFKSFSVINNNTLFYRLLFMILDNDVDKADQMLIENHIFFHGEASFLETYLRVVIHEKRGELKEATRLLQKIIYSTNYFISVFSRLHYIKIQIKRGKEQMVKPIIDSTQRYLRQNRENPLGLEAHYYVLKILKKRSNGKTMPDNQNHPILSVLHEYLIEK